MSASGSEVKANQQPVIELDKVKAMLQVIEAHLKSQETAKLPRYINPKLQKLIELNLKLDRIFNLRDSIQPEERARQTMHALMEAYLHLYTDERTKSWGHTKKGDNLVFMENGVLEGFQLIIPSHGKKEKSKEKIEKTEKDTIDARSFRTFAASPELLTTAVNSLFTRAMAEGVGTNDSSIYVNISKIITRMGDDAIGLWNGKLDTLLKGLSAEELNNIKISENPKKQDDKDHGKSFSAIYGNERAWRKVNENYFSELLISLVQVELYKVKTKMTGNLENAERKQLFAEDRALEGTLKKLVKNQENKSSANFSDELYKAVMETYIQAYVSERSKNSIGKTAKGPFLLKMEGLIKDFNLKTGSGLFIGADTKRPDSTILSSLASEQISSEARHYLVDKAVFKRALGEVFDQSGNDAEALVKLAQPIYVNSVKAVIRMGEAAVDVWNELAVSINAGEKNAYAEVVPFPDLVINDINGEEGGIEFSFACLAENKDLRQFVSTGVFQSQREFNERIREVDEEQVLAIRQNL